MRVQLFRRPIRFAVAAVAAAAACTLTLAVAPAVSAQSPTGPQPAIAPQTQPGQICILIYPPPPRKALPAHRSAEDLSPRNSESSR